MQRILEVMQGKLAIMLLGIVLALQLFFIYSRSAGGTLLSSSSRSSAQWQSDAVHQSTIQSSHPAGAQGWEYNYTRDSRNPALSQEECQIAFPRLYHELDSSVTYWADRSHTVLKEDTSVDWCTRGCLRLLIHENELRILETKDIHHFDDHHDSRRVIYTLSQIHRALLGATAHGEIMPTIEFAIAVQDYIELPDDGNDTHAIWTYDRKVNSTKDERMWLIPDFNFWAWQKGVHNSYSAATHRMTSHDDALENKIPQLAWRGDGGFSQIRKDLLTVAEGKDWADVDKSWVELDDFCRYFFTVYTEGHAWSGRLKYMLHCDSLPIIHELEFSTFYHHLLIPSGPEQNFLSVRRDWSDLEERVKFYLSHLREAKKIVSASRETFRERYLTPAAEACYWREMMRRYAAISFEPQPFDDVPIEFVGEKQKVRRLRGVAYELFIGQAMDAVEASTQVATRESRYLFD